MRWSAAARQDLSAWLQLLRDSPQRRIYLSDLPGHSQFWRGQVEEDDEALDAHPYTSQSIPVLTTDASGTGGGTFYKHHRLACPFPPEH